MTLTHQLRLAALKRAEEGGRVVGTYVIDDEGVIDLRALEDRGPRSRASDLASLAYMAGMFEDAADVSDLYAPEQTHSRGLFRRRGADATPGGTSPRPEQVALEEAAEQAADGDSAPADTPIPASDPVEAGDRVGEPGVHEPATRRPSAPVAEGEEDDVIELREKPDPSSPAPRSELSSLQSAVLDFNQLEPTNDPGVTDIESGIIYGASGELLDADRTSVLADDVEPPGPVELPAPTETTDTAEVADPPAPAPPDERDDQTPATTSGGDAVVCPACGGAATKDFANRFLELDFFSCNECFHMWHLAAEHDS